MPFRAKWTLLCWVCVGLALDPVLALEPLLVATLEVQDHTGQGLLRFEEYTGPALQDLLRRISSVSVIDSSRVYEVILNQQIAPGPLPGSPALASSLVHAVGGQYLLTGTARRYSDDGVKESLEVEFVLIDADGRSYAFRKSYTATGPRGPRRGYRELFDKTLESLEPELRDHFRGIHDAIEADRVARIRAEEERQRQAEEEYQRQAELEREREVRASAERIAEQERQRAAEERRLAELQVEARNQEERKAASISQGLENARNLLAAGQYDDALAAVESVRGQTPNSSEADILAQKIAEAARANPGAIRTQRLALLALQPVLLDPPPLRVPEQYAHQYLALRGTVQELNDGWYEAKASNGSPFAFKYVGRTPLAAGQDVVAVGIPAETGGLSALLGAAIGQNPPENVLAIDAVFVEAGQVHAPQQAERQVESQPARSDTKSRREENIMGALLQLLTGQRGLEDIERCCYYSGSPALEVSSLLEDYVVYSYSMNDGRDLTIAVEREPGAYYGEGQRMQMDSYFEIIGAGEFETVIGARVMVPIARQLHP